MFNLPLKNIRVIEFSHMVMGPTCGMVLGDLGAEVIKIEPLTGDRTRDLLGTGAGFFRTFNRNKKSFAVDLNQKEGREAVLQLIDQADVFIENFKPGRMDKMGFSYDELSKRNPKLIYAAHKGFLEGPYDNRLALDEVVQMMAGLAYMTGPKNRPLRAGSSVNDIMGGMFGAIGVLAALYERQQTGKGKDIQSALYENCVLLAAQHMQQYEITGKAAEPMPNRISAWAIYDVFEFANHEQLFVAATGDEQWKVLCNILNLNDLLLDQSLQTNNDRVKQRPFLLEYFGKIFKEMDAHSFAEILEKNQIPFAPIRKPEELFNDIHLNKSGGLAQLQLEDNTFTNMPLLPITLNGQRLKPRQAIPRIGEHTYQILQDLGYSNAQIQHLIDAQVLRNDSRDSDSLQLRAANG